jgi:hypothetical protein
MAERSGRNLGQIAASLGLCEATLVRWKQPGAEAGEIHAVRVTDIEQGRGAEGACSRWAAMRRAATSNSSSAEIACGRRFCSGMAPVCACTPSAWSGGDSPHSPATPPSASRASSLSRSDPNPSRPSGAHCRPRCRARSYPVHVVQVLRLRHASRVHFLQPLTLSFGAGWHQQAIPEVNLMEAGEDMEPIARELCDELYQIAGETSCSLFTEDGHLTTEARNRLAKS